MNTGIFTNRESNVRSYCRSFPVVFHRAEGAVLYGENGMSYIDFLAGAGALNYGHNNPFIKARILDYLATDGIISGLDLYTPAKRSFLEQFIALVLEPRKLDYKVQFCGPTGTNAVEAALKLARKVKQRRNVIAFMGGYHGMTLGSLAVTSNHECRAGAGLPLDNVHFVPYPVGCPMSFDSIAYIDAIVQDTHSGVEKPAAIILETVQAEGGVNVAPIAWMQRLRQLCDRHDILLICDDIQVGCGRTGPFFSFEHAGIVPDMVTLSKSISGYGLPMALLLMHPELDQWKPAEHNGTFRGNQLAFVAATAALEYREQFNLEQAVQQKAQFLDTYLHSQIASLDEYIDIRGIGMIWGIDLARLGGAALAKQVSTRCFEKGLIIERVGRSDTVIKLLPPLTIDFDTLQQGCRIIKQALIECLDSTGSDSKQSFYSELVTREA